MVIPKSLVPALLEHMVRPVAPWSRSAFRQFSGIPQRPKPDTMIVAPLGMSRTASAASLTTLFIGREAPGAPMIARSHAARNGRPLRRRERRSGLLATRVGDPKDQELLRVRPLC